MRVYNLFITKIKLQYEFHQIYNKFHSVFLTTFRHPILLFLNNVGSYNHNKWLINSTRGHWIISTTTCKLGFHLSFQNGFQNKCTETNTPQEYSKYSNWIIVLNNYKENMIAFPCEYLLPSHTHIRYTTLNGRSGV